MGIVVAIDGPAGAGKSSTAKEVARQLDYVYVDTGAMYRAVTLIVLEQNIDISDHAKISDIAKNILIEFRWIDDVFHTFVDNVDVTDKIRSKEVVSMVSPVSVIPEVREILANNQRKLADTDNIVMEGRDIGTNVFPNAEFKFYITADVEVRAKRRIHDYKKIGQDLTVEEIIEKMKQRDKIDSSREHSPLKKAQDAVTIDTSDLTFEEQVGKIVDIVKNK